ncbi:MAG: 4-Cys prefix domain-containing protein, partial [Planktothrix sp.]
MLVMSYCINPQCQKPQNPTHAILCQSCGSQLRLKDRYRAIRILGQSQWN